MRHEHASGIPTDDTRPHYTSKDRRISPRIQTPFAAIVRSVETDEPPFEEHTILDNLSSCGLYLRLRRQVRHNTGLLVLIRFAISPAADAPVSLIELHGTALRVEPQPGGAFGTAIRLTHHRFIYATAQSVYCAVRWPYPDVAGH